MVTALICIFSIIVVGISLVSVIFPALITANFGIQESESNQFEIGSNTITFLIGNLLLIGFGFLYFKKKSCTNDKLVLMDCDNTHDPEKIIEMDKKVGRRKNIVIIASRYQKGSQVKNVPFKRKILSPNR